MNALTLASSPDSAAPTCGRFVSAAPNALPMLTAPAATRPGAALPAPVARRGRAALGGTYAVAAREHDLGGAREVLFILRCHDRAEFPVLDRDVELVVAHPARDVEIGRTDARPQSSRRTAVFECSIVPFHSNPRTPASSSARLSRRGRTATARECRSRPARAAGRRRHRAPRRRAPGHRRSVPTK
jgi:hypothetical protein